MGKRDDYQSVYLDDDRRFADQINGALFGGRQVVKSEELEREDTQAVNLEEKGKTGRTARTIVDKSRLWRGRKLHVLVIENQNYVDYHMVLRNMLSESNEYNRQWKEKKRVHEGAHDTFEEYKTGLRQVFETVRYGKDKEKLHKIMQENREAYSRIDSETKEMLEVLANVKIPDAFKIEEEGEERYNMCKAFEDMRQEGIEIGLAVGMEKGIQALVQTCKELGASRETIMEKFELTREKAKAYVEEYYPG